jgi:hypothetical protein
MAQNINQITAPRVDFLDQNGKISREWYMYLYNLYTITGSGTGITPIINGGTGIGTLPINGQLLIGNEGAYSLNTLGAGAGVSVTNGPGTIVLANTGVLSNIAGTGISVSGATGNVTIANTGVLSVTGTAPVVSSGGTTPAISMAAANTTTNGYLTSTDWNTFNNKGSGTVTSVSVVSANGFAGTVATATTTPAITLTTTIAGLLKGNGTAISAAVANTDYVPLSTVLTKTADYTITNTDTWIINNKTGSAMTLTFPAASAWTGRSITVKNMQAQLVNSASSNIVPIDSTTAGTAILLAVVGNWATMVSDGTNWVIMQAASNNNLLLE